MNKHIIPTLIFILISIFGTAQTTWLGTTNSDWNEISNWDSGIPTATSHAIINDVANAPEITSTVNIQELTMNTDAVLNINGGSLNISTDFNNNGGFITLSTGDVSITGSVQNSGTISIPTGRTLSIAGSFTNDGTLLSTGTLRFFGTNNQILGGTNNFPTTTLTVDKTAGTVTLNQTMSITNNWTLPVGVTFDVNTGGNLSLSNDFTNNGTFEVNANVAIAGDLNNSGTLNLNSGGTLHFSQNFTNDATINTNSGNTVELLGTNNQTLNGTNPFNFETFTISKTSGSITLDQSVSIVQNLTIPTSVTMTLSSGQTLTLSNSLTNNGTFNNTATGNTIEFDGTSTISLAGMGVSTFRNLTINKTGAGNVSIDQDVTVNENLTITLGTLNLDATRTLQIANNFVNNGTFSANATSTVEFIGTNNQTLNGSTTFTLGLVNINKTSGTISFDQNVTMLGNLTIPTAVTLQLEASRQLNLAGDITNNGTFSANATSTTELTGTGSHLISGTGSFTFPTLSLNKTAGNVTFAQSTTITNNFTIPTGVTTTLNTGLTLFLQGSFSNLGTLTAISGSTVEFEGIGTHTLSGTGSFTFPNIIIDKTTGSLDINSDINISNDLTITSGTLNLTGGQRITLTGNLSIHGTFTANNTSTVQLNGTGTNNISGTGGIAFGDLNLNKTTGSVVFAQDVSIIQDFTIPTGVTTTVNSGQTLTLSNNFINNGTFDNTPTGNTIEFDGTSTISLSGTGLSTFRNLTVNKTGTGSLTIDQNTTVNENLTITSGTLNINSGRIVQVQEDFINNGNNFASPTGSIVELIGTNNQSIVGTAQIQFDVLQVSKTSGLILIDRNPVTVVQDFTIPIGVTFQIGGGDNFDVYNDFTNNGTVLNTAGGVRFIGAGTAELKGIGVMNFRDVFIQKTGAGNNVDIKTPINVSSWLILNTNSQMTLEHDITVGGAGSIARMQNHGVIVHNNHSFIVEGNGDYNIQGNTETEFYEIQITKTTGRLIFEQNADILQSFTVPTGVTLQVGANRDLRLEGNLIMNGTNDDTQAASEIYFTGTNDATVSGTGVPITFRNFHNAKTANNTVTITVDTEYQFNFRTNNGNITRIQDGLTTRVKQDFDTQVFGTLSLGNNVTMNYNSGNTEVRIENGGNFVQDLGSTNTIAGRVRVRNGGTFTVSNGSTLINSGRLFNSEDGGIVNLTANSNLTIFQDLQLRNSAVLSFDNTSWIEFQGGNNSDIETGNTNLNIPNLRINKTGDVVDLRRQVTVTNYLDLVSRHINSNDGDLLVFADGATHSGGSVASYIDGPARKIGNTNFEFPVGKNNRFGKLELQVTTVGASSDYFDVEYFGTIFLNTSLAAPLTDISDNEYWQVERSGTTTVTVVLHWSDDIASGIGPTAITESDLRVSQWNDTGLEWEDRGNTTGTPTGNFLASNAGQNNFTATGFWTLGYVGGDNDNWGATTWIGSVSNDWDDANNWQPAVVPDITINAIIIGDRVLTGNNDPNKKLGSTAVVKNLYMPRVIFPTGTATTQKPQLTIDAGFTIDIGDGTANTGLVECYGDIVNNGIIQTNTNNRYFNVYDEAIITNNNTINTTSRFQMYDDAEITNNNMMDIGGHFQIYDDVIVTNNADIDARQDLNIRDNSSFTNASTATLDISDDILMEHATDLTNDGIITVVDDIVIRNGHPDIINNNTITATGDLDARNTSTITNNTGATFGTARTTLRNDVVYTNDGTHNAISTITLTNNAELSNNTGAFFGIIGTANASIFLQNSSTITNAVGATLQSRRQFELQANTVTVTNNGLLRWRQDFLNNGSFSGSGTMEVYDNYTDTRIYGTSSPIAVHNFLLNRTGGTVNQEGNCTWTNAVTIPTSVTYDIENAVTTTIEGDFSNNGTFNLITNAQLFLEEDFTNNSTVNINDNTTVTLQGSTNGFINGTSDISLYSLINNKTTSTTDIENNIIVRENLTNTAGTFNISSGFSATLQGNLINNTTFSSEANGLVSFTGTANSDISGTGSVVFADLTIHKTGANVDLSREVEVSEDLTLTSGYINTSSANLLILRDNATSTSGNTSSFVRGPMRKIGDDSFAFPVGKISIWARIEISDLANTSTTDYFDAEYFIGNPTTEPIDVNLDHVSSLERWDLTRGNTVSGTGSTEAKVTLYWQNGTWSQIEENPITSDIDITVAHWNGALWENKGNDIDAASTVATGKVTTTNRLSSFSPFTFGSESGDSPLPITLLNFKAEKLKDTQTLLTWQTASEENSSHFEVERSADLESFEKVTDIEAQGFSATLQSYHGIDTQPLQGINYYRLKMIDQDGSFEYSEVLAVNFESSEKLGVSKIYPNPFTTKINVELSLLTNQKYQIVLRDLRGNIVWNAEKLNEIAGTQTITLENLNNLPSATYLLEVIQKGEKIVKRVIKM